MIFIPVGFIVLAVGLMLILADRVSFRRVQKDASHDVPFAEEEKSAPFEREEDGFGAEQTPAAFEESA